MPHTYTVAPGDTLPSLAEQFGFADWHTIYGLPQNASFRQNRPNENLLHPGDELYIPDKELREENCATEKKHRFVLGKSTQVLRLALASGEPPGGDESCDGSPAAIQRKALAHEKYVLHVDDQLFEGTTDGDGQIKQAIPIGARLARLVAAGSIWDLEIGALNPVMQPTPDGGLSGATARLKNLGYFSGNADSVAKSEMNQALRRFQADSGLENTGALDDATKSKLAEIHGV